MANTIKKILEYFSENADCSDDEVQLFRKFGKGITNYTNAVYVAETHGAHKANVEFKSQVHYVPTRCEIADLLLIAVDPLNGIRATFLQVKKRTGHRGYKWVSLSNHSPLPMFDFKGQFNQWELLATLRKIRGVGKFHPPKDLLSGASSCAIGSFGVFYCDNSNKVDMLYSIAKYISASTKGGNNVKGHTRMLANLMLRDMYTQSNGRLSVITTLSMSEFLFQLFRGRVGSPICFSADIGSNKCRPPQRQSSLWLLNYIDSALQAVTAMGQEDSIASNLEGSDIKYGFYTNTPEERGLSNIFYNDMYGERAGIDILVVWGQDNIEPYAQIIREDY